MIGALSDAAPVDLERIVAEAALLTRVDRKYLLAGADATAILHRLAPAVRVLDIDGRREFGYESVYFDTPDRLAYRRTAHRRRRRFKLRTRAYLDTGEAFLELKTKNGRGRTVKDRLPCDPVDRRCLTPERRAEIAALLTSRGLDPEIAARLRPTLVSTYRRATLLLPDGSRATVDTSLRWEDPRAGRMLDLTGAVILESKTTGRASELDRRLWRAGHRPCGISKFGTGTAALHPGLPANRWTRELRGLFAGPYAGPYASSLGDPASFGPDRAGSPESRRISDRGSDDSITRTPERTRP